MTQSNGEFHLNIVSQVAQYIYDNSEHAILLEELAAFSGFSKYHFNRIFFAATGFQLGEFIKRQKLEKAMYLLRSGNTEILHVALAVGYESASSFTRAFKTNFGLTPSAILQGAQPYNERAGQLAPKCSTIEQEMTPHWRAIDQQIIYGLYGKGFTQQSFTDVADKLYKRLSSLAQPLNYQALEPVGVSIDNPWVGDQSSSQFFAGFMHGLDDHKNELDTYHLCDGDYACFIHKGSHATMWQTISQIYAQWVLPNRIKLKDQHILQRYINNPQNVPIDQQITELCFAVEKSTS